MFPIQAPILIVPTAQAQQALAAVSVRAIYDAQCLRQLKLKNQAAAEPVLPSASSEVLGHRNIRDVHRPDLVRPRDLNAPQKIRIDLVARLRPGGARIPD